MSMMPEAGASDPLAQALASTAEIANRATQEVFSMQRDRKERENSITDTCRDAYENMLNCSFDWMVATDLVVVNIHVEDGEGYVIDSERQELAAEAFACYLASVCKLTAYCANVDILSAALELRETATRIHAVVIGFDPERLLGEDLLLERKLHQDQLLNFAGLYMRQCSPKKRIEKKKFSLRSRSKKERRGSVRTFVGQGDRLTF